MKSKIVILMFGMILLLSLSRTATASQLSTVSFTYWYMEGSLVFPEEAHPTDTMTYNLTVVAYAEVTISDLTLNISGLVGEKWQTIETAQIPERDMIPGENFTTPIIITLPLNTSERLQCVIDASTQYGFVKATFYATYVRTVTYDELLDSYNELLANYNTLQADYNQLLTNYDALTSNYSSLEAEHSTMHTNFDSLNASYETLMVNYNSLTTIKDSLQESYTYIKAKYDASTGELNIVRSLMYILGITTVIFVATTVYFRQKAPYVVLRKETVAKPEKE